MEFTPIMTQADFDAAISDRLKRERETISKRYADYEDLKGKVSTYEQQLSDQARQIQEATDKQTTNDQTVADLTAKLKSYETASVKTRIALELGLPYELAGRLTGDTEDAIRKDAETFSKFVGKPKETPPLRSTEPSGVDKRSAALKSLSESLIQKGE